MTACSAEVRAAPAAAAGELAWFESLFRAHFSATVRWALALGVERESAEDVAQQVFLVAYRKLSGTGDSCSKGWLFEIARRVCANHRRGRARDASRRSHLETPADVVALEDDIERARAAAMLQRFLDELPEEQRLVFVLYEVEDLDAPEVARVLSIRADQVHARVRLVRDKLARFVASQRGKEQT